MIEGLSTPAGRIGVLAIDHRDSLRAVIAPEDPQSVSRETIIDLKRLIIRELADLASGVMLEPEYSIPDLVGDLPEGCGFTAALESQGYSADPSRVPTELLEGWSPAQALAHGASAGKLLAYYSPGATAHAAAQDRVIAEAVDQCRAAGLPLLLEPLPFPSDGPGAATVAAVRGTIGAGADLMKVAWPGEEYLDELIDVLGDRPWVLLSGGRDFDAYLDQVRLCLAHGAIGFMAGRAVWREATTAAPQERAAVLRERCRPRLAALMDCLV